ncbi:MAG: DNA ligase [Deltaproteobacteria bacterium RIFOXYD12_FULL_57_12]|nr:MAG: DNA ligase [Deltaproteobacteria bacterium RIFOXYD12_FULL_57_12]
MIRIFACVLLFLCGCLHSAGAAALDLMLPQVYEEHLDVSGWLVSEKLDGVRGYWDGKRLMSKNGIPFYPPAEFIENFPDFPLEGEIWGGRSTFVRTAAVVKQRMAASGWLDLQYAVFDAPAADGSFVQRLATATDWFAAHHSDYAFVIPQKPVKSKDELRDELRRVESLGGEGLIVRRPDALYAKGRSGDVLKVKSHQDMEATVVAHVPGTGKNRGRMGALLVELPNGIRCKIGTGFTDEERKNPPPVGATITFKYRGLYPSGIPKFPSFFRIREDMGL